MAFFVAAHRDFKTGLPEWKGRLFRIGSGRGFRRIGARLRIEKLADVPSGCAERMDGVPVALLERVAGGSVRDGDGTVGCFGRC